MTTYLLGGTGLEGKKQNKTQTVRMASVKGGQIQGEKSNFIHFCIVQLESVLYNSGTCKCMKQTRKGNVYAWAPVRKSHRLCGSH
ncbi:hypothetical protein, partial [Microcystis aeruginosa]|uniref:hypothetical protein n=1 Tax=Microcystis aeruginosa TaxID=1126 RepID=UPI001C408141